MGMEEWSQVELWKQALFNPIIRIRVRPKGSLFQTGGDALCQKKGKKFCVWTPSGTPSITGCSGHLTSCTPKAKPVKHSPA